MRSTKTTVLVVDDDPRMVELMQHILDLEGYRVITASGGTAGLAAFARESPDLVLLDIQMPDVDGYRVCRQIRALSQVPIIMVSVKDDDRDKIKGLECGADDYVTKPFCVQELTARIKSMLRRARYADESDEAPYRCGPLLVDFSRYRVQCDNTDINLTATEYRLLSYLAHNAGRVVTSDRILAKVWGKEYSDDRHLLRVNMARLRQKLGDNSKSRQYIVTKPGLGYMMVEPYKLNAGPKQLALDARQNAIALR